MHAKSHLIATCSFLTAVEGSQPLIDSLAYHCTVKWLPITGEGMKSAISRQQEKQRTKKTIRVLEFLPALNQIIC